MDDFERAVLVLYDHSGNAELKPRAIQYLETLKHSNQWIVCVQRFFDDTYSNDATRFVCLQTAEAGVTIGYASLDTSTRMVMRDMLLRWLKANATRTETVFIKNKLAQLFVAVFLIDFPTLWPSFFVDVIEAISYGETGIDMVVRILEGIDSTIANRDMSRSEQQAALHSSIKDAMRLNSLDIIADAWFHILSNHESMTSSSSSSTVSMCLTVMSKFIAWIDISLVVNERFISLLFSFMNLENYREQACSCFIAIVDKGMDARARNDMIKSLNLLQMIRTTASSLSDDATDFAIRLATLVATIGSETIQDIVKMKGTECDSSSCYEIVDQTLPLLFMFLMHGEIDVSLEVLPFAKDYANLMKQQCGAEVTNEQSERFKLLTQCVITKMRYPLSFNFKTEGEHELEFIDYRANLRELFDIIYKLDGSGTISVIISTITTTLHNLALNTANFADVEVALEIIHAIAENSLNSIEASEFSSSIIVQPFLMIFHSNVPQFSHRAVLTKYLDVLERYSKYFTIHTEELPAALFQFLGEFGIRNRSASVRSWSAYMFVRFLKNVRDVIAQYSNDIIQAINDFLLLNLRQEFSLSFDDRLFLFEAAGIVIALDSADPSTQSTQMTSLIEPLLISFSNILEKELPLARSVPEQESFANQLHFIISAVTRLSKGFPNGSSFQGSGCCLIFARSLDCFISALSVHVNHSLIQTAVKTFLNRMIICMDESIVEYLPMALNSLIRLDRSQAEDLQWFIPLLNQIVGAFKATISPLLIEIIPPFLHAIFALLHQEGDPNDTTLKVEIHALRKAYFSFISCIVNANLHEIFTTETNAPYFTVVLTSLVQGAADTSDTNTQRSCFMTLKKLIATWIPGVEQCMFTEIIPLTFDVFTKPNFNVDDGHLWLTIVEIGSIHKTILERHHQEYIHYLKGVLLPSVGVSLEAGETFTNSLIEMDKANFGKFLKEFAKRHLQRR